ncbi:MAG: transporter ATP-binding protein [Pseudomonadota bacterium]|jgi:branched-chain amino acid transport system ATP-binding protein
MMLELDKLTAAYGQAIALENLSLQIGKGELVAILGPNGAGKSTLLKVISRALPSRGTLNFNGQSLHQYSTEQVVGQGICHCPEGRRLFPELSVIKNLQLGAYLRHDRDAVARDLERVYALFPILAERRDQIVSTLSGGQQQMVAIGRALMGAPQLLLLDEPSVGIAHRLKMEIFAAIRKICDAGVAILVAEQDAQSALHIADRAYVLEHGSVAQEGTAKTLSSDDRIRKIYLGVA